MTTKVTDSVMDLSDVQQDIALNGKKVIGVTATPSLDDEATSKKYVDDTIAALLLLRVPPGLGPLPWAGAVAPTGWLLCEGQSLLVSAYPDLFAAIGYTYGGAGANFNVPDARGRFVLGKNNTGSGVNRVNRTQSQNLGGVTGQENYALQPSEGPAHTHSATIASSGSHLHSGATTDIEPDHTHTYYDRYYVSGAFPQNYENGNDSNTQDHARVTAGGGQHSHNVTVPTNSSSHTHPVSIGTTAAASAHENTPPFLTTNYIIKT